MQVRHTLLWEAVWRYLDSTTRTVPMSVREQNGHSLKSSLVHTITMDRRNKPVFPTSGSLIDITTEFAGLGGDVGFLKNEIKMQSNVSLFKDFVSSNFTSRILLLNYVS
jgi:outer membrane protein insertion porin family